MVTDFSHLPEKFHGQMEPGGLYSSWGQKGLNMTKQARTLWKSLETLW